MKKLLLTPILLSACASLMEPAPTSPPPSPTPTIAPPKGDRPQVMKGWLPEYDAFIKEQVESAYPELLALPQAQMNSYCPAYPKMEKPEKLQFWADFLFAVAKPESGHNRALIYLETTMGGDPITGMQVTSEGLLQLSYQDGPNYKGSCLKFDWAKDKDKQLALYKSRAKQGDGTATLHDAYLNLDCGLHIMRKHLTEFNKSSRFQDALGKYWYVMQTRHPEEYEAVRTALRTRTNACKSENYF